MAAARSPEQESSVDWLDDHRGDHGGEKGMACSDPDNQGVLHIAMGDIGGAAGTVLFQFVISQILYAEAHHLTPFVHLNNVSYIVYDNAIHAGRHGGDGIRITGRVGRQAGTILRPGGHWRDAVPGPLDDAPERIQTLFLPGTGVWNHYFEPVSSYVPGDASCRNKSIVTLSLKHITPGLHGFARYAPRAWRYPYLPDYVTQPHLSLTEWLEPQRQIGIRVASQYLRMRPSLLGRARRANPNCSWEFPCLGLHIRHSDKASGRVRIETSEFLPYAKAFVHQGGQAVYLATDSSAVLDEIRSTWPPSIVDKLRTLDDLSVSSSNGSSEPVLRSSDGTAVFDLHANAHHATNQQVLVDIASLSYCQYLVHGLSAVSEAAIWMSPDGLYRRSINLEDPERAGVAEFATLVQMVQRNESQSRWPATSYQTDDWWNTSRYEEEGEGRSGRQGGSVNDCSNYRGVLHIASVGHKASAGPAFFTHVLNQLLYARNHKLLPWIHLDAASGAQNVFDDQYHTGVGSPSKTLTIERRSLPMGSNPPHAQHQYPAPPDAYRSPHQTSYSIEGNGAWESYFAPVATFKDVEGCVRKGKPVFTLTPEQVSPGLDSYSPDSIKAWRYDTVPDHVWPSTSHELKRMYERMRRAGHNLAQSFFRFRPYLQRRADRVNPTEPHRPCLGVHFRNGDKSGTHRRKIPVEQYLPYLQAFVEAGGEIIYVASDSHTILQFMGKIVPHDIWSKVRTQGDHVVRSSPNKKNPKAVGWPSHMIGSHHRVNAETFVDVLSLSRCRWLIHTHSTVSEASIYLNLDLHNASVNLEDPQKMTHLQFGDMIRADLKQLRARYAGTEVPPLDGIHPVVTEHLDNVPILKRHQSMRGGCRTNAIVYLAQKRHSSYGRDSAAIFQKSLKLLYKNYLSDPKHMNKTDVFIFHTGDFNQTDLLTIESLLGPASRGAVHLVDLSRSEYWARPKANAMDDPTSWYAFPLFSEGYRRMMHWYAIDIWRFFRDYNEGFGCQYRYLFRLDEDSFIHSKISYDIFDLFASKRYVYGYRLCAYEMAVARRMWSRWRRKYPDFVPIRELDYKICGFYNNLFVADLDFFNSPEVSRFLDFIDGHGHIYRRRLGDLMIHTMAVIAFAPMDRVHRFLDFTYEHSTFDNKNGCLAWGGIQAGYDDRNASEIMNDFYRTKILGSNCSVNATYLSEQDLSPSYSHLPADRKGRVQLHTLVRGWVETSDGKGILSG